jgi:hypothetical protein
MEHQATEAVLDVPAVLWVAAKALEMQVVEQEAAEGVDLVPAKEVMEAAAAVGLEVVAIRDRENC